MHLEIAKIIVSVLITAAITYWVARKSGSFKRKEIDVLLGGRSLIHKPLDCVIFGYPPGVHPDNIVVCYLPLQVVNIGDLSLKEVVINWKIPSICRCRGLEEEHLKRTAGLGEKPIRREVNRADEFDYISYLIPKIDPNVELWIREYLNIAVCNWPFKVQATSKDWVPFQVTGRVDIRVPVEISVSATDVTAIVRTFRVRAYQVQSEDQLAAQISRPDLEGMKKDLKRACPKTPDSKIEEVAEKLTSMGGLPRLEAIVVMAKLNKIFECGDYSLLEEDMTQSKVSVLTQ